MENLIARIIIAALMLPVMACAQAGHTSPSPLQGRQANEMAAEVSFGDQTETLAALLERCWGAPEIKSSRNTDFDQDGGVFQGEVRRRWCHTSLDAWGPVERHGKRDYFARIDSLALRFSNDTITAQLHERAGEQPRLTVNGHEASADWWRAGSRERVLRLAQVPLP
jgi:hypothetical protein